MRLETMCSADGHWEYVKIVTDGHSVNKLAVKMMMPIRGKYFLAAPQYVLYRVRSTIQI